MINSPALQVSPEPLLNCSGTKSSLAVKRSREGAMPVELPEWWSKWEDGLDFYGVYNPAKRLFDKTGVAGLLFVGIRLWEYCSPQHPGVERHRARLRNVAQYARRFGARSRRLANDLENLEGTEFLEAVTRLDEFRRVPTNLHLIEHTFTRAANTLQEAASKRKPVAGKTLVQVIAYLMAIEVRYPYADLAKFVSRAYLAHGIEVGNFTSRRKGIEAGGGTGDLTAGAIRERVEQVRKHFPERFLAATREGAVAAVADMQEWQALIEPLGTETSAKK
jgi:hypothetical protein